MKAKAILVLSQLFLVCLPSLLGQNFSTEWGVIGDAEKQLTRYAKDPDASAVVLFDKGDSYFFYDNVEGYKIRFTRSKRIKILDNAGVDYAEVIVPFYVDESGRAEEVRNVVGVAYNLRDDGSLETGSLDPGSVFEIQYQDEYRAKKFTFPNVRAGTIVEYQYVLETPFLFNLPDWDFQDEIPTVYSEYTLRMIPFYEYAIRHQGYSRFSYTTSRVDSKKRVFGKTNPIEFQDLITIFIQRDVPAFKDESYITSVNDFIMRMDFQLAKINYPQGGTKEIMSTWDKLIDEYLKNDYFGKYLRKSNSFARSMLDDNSSVLTLDAAGKAKALIGMVKNACIWDGTYSKYTDLSAKEFQQIKEGNSAEINLLLVALLREAGLRADPVLVSTRQHGRIEKEYPFSTVFNHVVVRVGGDENAFLCDASAANIQYNRLPSNCLNGEGLVVHEGRVEWVSLTNDLRSADRKELTLSLDPEAYVLQAELSLEATEYDAYEYRSDYAQDEEEWKAYFLSNGFSRVDDLEFGENIDLEQPFRLKVSGSSPLDYLGGQIVLQPFLGFPPLENPLTQAKRSYPVDMTFAKERRLLSRITLPAGYQAVDLPPYAKHENDLMSFVLQVRRENENLEVEGSYVFKKAVYSPQEYVLLRYSIDKLIEAFNASVVLEKIDTKP
ncbi:MAG: DUF3857 domain-containing protein [Bacteroidales bacterium]